MATDFTQDALLHFLQSSGGSVKNSDLLLHFRNFIRDHPDRDRNRELFKKYVNSVATVKQIDGVSHVVLRKKFRGYVSGSGGGGSPGPLRLPAERNIEPSSENTRLSPSGRAEKPRQKPQVRDVTTPTPSGVSAGKTILPAAGIMLSNNNSVETNFNVKEKQQQVIETPEVSGRCSAAAQVGSRITEKAGVKTPNLSEAPAKDQHTGVGQHRVGPDRPVVAAVRHHEEARQHVPAPEPLRERQACLQPEGGLHEEPPLHHNRPDPQVAPRRFRYRPSYKSAVSCDEDEEDEEEEVVPIKRSSAGGAWPTSVPPGDMGRAISVSSPCIIDPPAPPIVVASSSSSERKTPKIYIQDAKGEMLQRGVPGWSLESGVGQRGEWVGRGLEPGSVSGESTSSRRSLPLEAERLMPSPDRAEELLPHYDINTDRRYPQTAGVQLESKPGQSQRAWLSSSHSSILFPPSDTGLSISDWPQSGSNRGSGRNNSYEDLRVRAGKTEAGTEIQGSQRANFESGMHHANRKVTPPWHHSTGHLLDNQESMARGLPLHLSTGNLYDDREEAESSDGSTSSPQLQQRSAVARQLSRRQLRSRMCHSMGADLDQLLQRETRGGGGGNEAARLNRLNMISSSLSLRYNLSSSSLSSCSTPPRCHSLNDLIEGVEGKGGRRSLPNASPSSTAHPEGPSRQSLVPLEAREHAWLVKGAAGAWPDIYSLFREDSTLLNKRDFISGFTVLHWIAKHGDHRVLNTLWYGVQKAGLTFDINARSTCGHTPLHIAAIHGHKNIMRLLVSKFNADVRLRDTAGKKPWQYLSRTMSSDIFQLLGTPSRAAGRVEGGVGRVDTNWKPEQHQRRRRRHYLSSASSGGRPLTIAGTTKVKRSSSIAAFLKHKSLHRLHGHQSDSSI